MPLKNRYQSGFGNEFATEALEGVLPEGQNLPQRAAYGLYVEQLNGTSFTAPRAANRRTWMYRIRPSVTSKPYAEISNGLIRTGPSIDVIPPPDQMVWNPLPIPAGPTDFAEGIVTMAGAGDPTMQCGVGLHFYAANRSMTDRFFANVDGELLIVPQTGSLRISTELGILEVAPTEICVVPRAIKFRVELLDDAARGLICENYGLPFRLPELGPIGANGLANTRDFLTPVASFDDREGHFQLITKSFGKLWAAEIDHSPLDVVAWHGNYAPYKYDLLKFNTINTVSYDHTDPSILTVLTAPTAIPGASNVDFIVFPPRWLVAEHTFRPPYFHRNLMNEVSYLIRGKHENFSEEGFLPGGLRVKNSMTPHGPTAESYERNSSIDLKPHYLDGNLASMFETQLPLHLTKYAAESPLLQRNSYQYWQGLKRHFELEPVS